jgi:hypothetical protein
MLTRCRKLSLKLLYQLTHKTMICRSKCRPFKHIFDRDDSLDLFIIARTLAFAPEPKKQPIIAETGSQEEAGAPEVLIDDDIDHAEVQVTPSRF